jgi:hypothetical protein
VKANREQKYTPCNTDITAMCSDERKNERKEIHQNLEYAGESKHFGC